MSKSSNHSEWHFELTGRDVTRKITVSVEDSVVYDDSVYVRMVSGGGLNPGQHIPFEQAEEIALDILARLRDRGFYGNL